MQCAVRCVPHSGNWYWAWAPYAQIESVCTIGDNFAFVKWKRQSEKEGKDTHTDILSAVVNAQIYTHTERVTQSNLFVVYRWHSRSAMPHVHDNFNSIDKSEANKHALNWKTFVDSFLFLSILRSSSGNGRHLISEESEHRKIKIKRRKNCHFFCSFVCSVLLQFQWCAVTEFISVKFFLSLLFDAESDRWHFVMSFPSDWAFRMVVNGANVRVWNEDLCCWRCGRI